MKGASPTLQAADAFIRQALKDMLEQCTEPQILLFKRMYSHKNLNASISEVVDAMPEEKIEWAIAQVERTLAKRKAPNEQA